MKKLKMIFVVLAIMTGTSAFANTGDKVSKAIKAEFQKNFIGAENVTWEIADEFYFASFELNGTSINAAYNEMGTFLGASRKIPFSSIPLGVSQSIRSNYADYEIGNMVTEVVFEGLTFYYVNVEGATRKLKLKCFSDGQINIENNSKK